MSRALALVARAALEWIDAVPKSTALPTMPGFDRDWANEVVTAALAQPEQQSVPMSEYKTLQALVSSQGIRLMEYESQPEPADIDTEAIAWAYQKLLAFGVGSNMDSAMMLDRLNLMLLESSEVSQ